MRIATLINGLLLGLALLVQSFLVSVGSSLTEDEASGAAAAIGILMALIWLVASALVITFPVVSIVLFAVAGLLGFAGSGESPDLAVWGGVSLVLALFSFFGWRGKVKDRREQQAEQARQTQRDARMEEMIRQSQGQSRPQSAHAPPSQAASVSESVSCPSCGHSNPAGRKFCAECGVSLAKPLAVESRTTVTCPQCAHENEKGTKFCAECGSRLSVSAVRDMTTRTPSPATKTLPHPPPTDPRLGFGKQTPAKKRRFGRS